MDDIRQEKLNVDPALNFRKILYRQSCWKKFGTHLQKFMIFKGLEK